MFNKKTQHPDDIENYTDEQLRTIIENMDGGVSVAMLDESGVRLSYANERYYSLFGYTREQFAALKDAHGNIHPDDTERVRTIITDVKNNHNPATFTYRAFKKDGNIVSIQCSSSVTQTVSGYILLSLLTDVSTLADEENELRAERNRATELMNATPGGIAVIEMERGKPETLFKTFYNDYFFSYSGYTRSEYEALRKNGELYFVLEEDKNTLLESARKISEGDIGADCECTVRCRCKQGGYRWLLFSGKLTERRQNICVINLLVMDITARKEAQDRQRISEEMLRIAVETDHRALITYNIKTNTCRVESNSLFSVGYGETFENVPDSIIQKGIAAPDSIAELRRMFQLLRGGERKLRVSLHLLTDKNEFQWFECNAQVVNDADGKPDHAVLVFHNITQQMVKEAVFRKWQQSIENRPVNSYTLFRSNLSREASIDEQAGELLRINLGSEKSTFNARTQQYAEDFVYFEDREKYLSLLNSDVLLARFYRGYHTETLEYREISKDGSLKWRQVTIELVEYLNSTDVQAFMMYEDIDEKKKAELKAKELAETDPLTGALNRGAFMQRAKETIKNKGNLQHALIIVDIDGFKTLNDTFGHAAGDQALIDITAVLRSLIRDDDIICRLGGDEFLIWLRNVPYDAVISKKAQQICRQLRKAYSTEVQISASVGISVYPRDGSDFDTLYQNADKALYRVKNDGKDNYSFFSTTGDSTDEQDDDADEGRKDSLYSFISKRRMLIAGGSDEEREQLSDQFDGEFQIENVRTGTDAVTHLRHFGSSLSAVLLDSDIPGVDCLEIIERMQNNAELRTVPIIMLNSDGYEAGLRAIQHGAADFITKPFDLRLTRLRVQSAVSKAENERLRAQNSYLKLQRDEEIKFHTVLESTGTVVIEYNWRNQIFIYDNTIGRYLAGKYNSRGLWTILLSDNVADSADVMAMRKMISNLADNRKSKTARSQVLLMTPSGKKHWFRINVYKQINDFGLAERMIITFNDIHEEVIANEKLRFQVTRDELTGLYSRNGFMQRAAELIDAAPAGFYTMTCIDIEKFKVINDQYGSEKGDEVLRQFGQALAYLQHSAGAVCGHMMADNFAVLRPKEINKYLLAEVHRMAEKLDGSLPPIRFILGRCLVDDKSLSVNALYDRAAIAKNTIKGRYDTYAADFDESMRTDILHQQKITGQMNAALAGGQFELWLQPQYNHTNGALFGAEALVRWRHPQDGLIPPSEFIPVFERNGFIFEVDKFIWERACSLLRGWLDRGIKPVPVSVNISRYDMFNNDIVDVISGLTAKYNLPPELLHLEITETAFIKSAELIISVIKRLIKLGFTVEIDDFGSGYSSLNTLKDVPAQVLKMDMSFLQNSNSVRGSSIIESIVRMAKWLGMSVIAEGVETKEQADYLQSIGCEFVQGYLYAKPMPEGAFEQLFGQARTELRPAMFKTAGDSDALWNPESPELMIFDAFAGGACIFEYRNGSAEIIRRNREYDRIFSEGFEFDNTTPNIESIAYLTDDQKNTLLANTEKAIKTGKPSTCEVYMVNGSRHKYIRTTVKVIAQTDDRYLLYSILHDITEQHEAKLEREKALKQLKLMTDSIPGGLATFECTNEHIKITYCNPGFCSIFGVTAGEYEKNTADDTLAYVFSNDKEEITRQYQNMLKNGTDIDCVYRVHIKTGGFRWVHHRASVSERRGETTIVYAALFDITDMQEEREQLRLSEEELRVASAHNKSTTCRYSIADSTVTIASPTAKRLELPEVLHDVPYGRIKKGIISPDTQKAYAAFYEGIRHGEKESTVTFKKKLPAGWRWINAHATTMFSGSGQPLSAIITFVDITDQQEKETVYKKWQQRLTEKGEAGYTLYRVNLNKNESYDTKEGTLLSFATEENDHTSFNERTATFAQRYVDARDREAYTAFVDSDKMLASYHRGKRAAELEFRGRIYDGSVRWLRLSVELVEYPHSTDVEAYMMFEDINDIMTEKLQTKHEAETDPLTGLLNRSAFRAGMTKKLNKAQQDALTALFIIDVDGFKLINDSFGHIEGDRVLIDVGKTIQSVLEDDDLICRLGGDEFLVCIGNMPDKKSISERAKQICRLMHKVFNLDISISVSLGIAVFPENGGNFEELYARADKALYHIKEHGKDNCAFYSDNMIADAWNSTAKQHSGRRRMLIVEDNKENQLMLKNAFVDDFDIKTVTNGEQALTELRCCPYTSVVLLDLIMPGMNGFEVLDKMRGNPEMQQIPVIVVSGLNDRETNMKVIRYGASDFVTKPVDVELLRLRVASVISKAENEHLRTQNSVLNAQRFEAERIAAIMENDGTVVIQYSTMNDDFNCDKDITELISGNFDKKEPLWDVLAAENDLSLQEIQKLKDMATEGQGKTYLHLKTPAGVHNFRIKAISDKQVLSEGKRILFIITDMQIFEQTGIDSGLALC